MRKTNSVKEIAVVSDIQSGHIYAPLHKNMREHQTDTMVAMNKQQEILWEAWCECAKRFNNPDILMMNAEALEGHRNPDVWSTDPFDQIENAKKLLLMFNAKKYMFTRGSNWHVRIDDGGHLYAEDMLAKEMNAEKIQGFWAPVEHWLEVDGCIMNFAHHISGTKVPQYRSTSITREMFVTYVNQKHLWNAKVITRSHVQYFWHIESESHHGFITPGWQLRTPYAIQYLGNGGVAALGMIRFRIVDGKFDWYEKDDKFLIEDDRLRPELSKL